MLYCHVGPSCHNNKENLCWNICRFYMATARSVAVRDTEVINSYHGKIHTGTATSSAQHLTPGRRRPDHYFISQRILLLLSNTALPYSIVYVTKILMNWFKMPNMSIVVICDEWYTDDNCHVGSTWGDSNVNIAIFNLYWHVGLIWLICWFPKIHLQTSL